MKKIIRGGVIIIAQRGRGEGKTTQKLEQNYSGNTNTITGVQKDNLVIQINDSTESGGKQPFQQNRVYDTDGILPALPAQMSSGSHAIQVKSATKDGFETAQPGDSINLSMPNSKTRRGRVGVGVAQTLDTQANQSVLLQGNIRRLTEIECERLQGFPETKTKIIFQWLENQNNSVDAANQNHKFPKRALNVGEKELNQTALCVGENFNINSQQISKPAQQNVHINLGESIVEIHSQEKLLFRALTAESQKSLTRMKIGDFVLLLATMNLIQEKIIQDGREELQAIEQLSIHQKNGEMHVRLYGNEIMQLANDVTTDLTIPKEHLKFTTLNLLNTKNLELILKTLFCYAIRVIYGFTQIKIQKESLLLEITSSQGWTKFGIYQQQVWINKKEGTFKLIEGIKEISRTQRYKMCGNAVTRDVVELIGRKLLNPS